MLEFLNGIALSFDIPILDWIQSTMKCGFMDVFMTFITMFGDGGIFWIALSCFLLLFPKHRKTALTMGLALVLGLIFCNILLKPLVARPRPAAFIEEMKLVTQIPATLRNTHDFSFPSGHTIASFEASVVLLLRKKEWGIPAFILAILVAFSRLYLYLHYPTDVLVSIVLGTLFAIIAYFSLRNAKFCEYAPGKYEKNA